MTKVRTPEELLKDPNVVAVIGTCKICGKKTFIGDDGICVVCWATKRTKP